MWALVGMLSKTVQAVIDIINGVCGMLSVDNSERMQLDIVDFLTV